MVLVSKAYFKYNNYICIIIERKFIHILILTHVYFWVKERNFFYMIVLIYSKADRRLSYLT